MNDHSLWKQAKAGAVRLPADGVHVWRINGGEISPELSPEERSQASEIKLATVRDQFVTSRSGVRGIVAGYLDCAPRDAAIIRPAEGKPFVQCGETLEFSVSHTRGIVFAAFSRVPVGLDIERRDRRTKSFMDIARRYYGDREIDSLEKLDSDTARQEMFLRQWVCREAMTKLAGDGIAKGMEHAEVLPDRSGQYRDRKVHLTEFGDKEHLGAVACFHEFAVKGWFVL